MPADAPPTPRRLFLIYLSVIMPFLMADAVWLGTMMDRLYRPAFSAMLADTPVLWAAIAFYLAYPAGIVIFAEDITERTRAEEALHESEESFHAMLNGIPQLAWMAEADGHIFWYNQRWYDYTGSSFALTRDWGWEQFIHPDDLANTLRRWQHSLATGEAFEDVAEARLGLDLGTTAEAAE